MRVKLGSAYASVDITPAPCGVGATIKGWIHAATSEDGTKASELLAGLFGVKHIGGFDLDHKWLWYPFEFEVKNAFNTRFLRDDDVETTLRACHKIATRNRLTKKEGATPHFYALINRRAGTI